MVTKTEEVPANVPETITLTKDQLDEAIKTAVAEAVGQAVAGLPKASVKPTQAGQMVTQYKRKIPTHMNQPIYQPDTAVKLVEESERNWTWRKLEEFDEVPEGAETLKRRQNKSIVTYVREHSALHNLVGTVKDLPRSLLHEKEWLYPVNWPGQGVDSVPESEIVPSYS